MVTDAQARVIFLFSDGAQSPASIYEKKKQKIPPDDVLESLYKLRIRECDQLKKTVFIIV